MRRVLAERISDILKLNGYKSGTTNKGRKWEVIYWTKGLGRVKYLTIDNTLRDLERLLK